MFYSVNAMQSANRPHCRKFLNKCAFLRTMSRTYPVGRDAVVLQLAHRRCQEKHWTRPTARFTLFLFDSVPLPQMRWSKFDAKMGPTMANISLTQDRSKIRLYERPVNVKEAAKFLGVSPSLVYAYVERKQIPHFRMMGPRDPVPIIGAGIVAATIPREWRNRWLEEDGRRSWAARSTDVRIQNFGRSATRTRKEKSYGNRRHFGSSGSRAIPVGPA